MLQDEIPTDRHTHTYTQSNIYIVVDSPELSGVMCKKAHFTRLISRHTHTNEWNYGSK